MPQLVNHGKKTVPSEIRRDLWRPYFSIDFPDNDGGRVAGLEAYRRLREFSLRRQFDPNQEDLMSTQEDINRFMKSIGSPARLRDKYLSKDGPRKEKFKFPVLGMKLPQRLRARKLMDQKATSVADMSLVLGLALDELKTLYSNNHNAKKALLRTTEGKLRSMGKRGRRRLRMKRAEEEKKAAQIAERQELAQTHKAGSATVRRGFAKQLAMEFDVGIVDGSQLKLKEPRRNNYRQDDCEIRVNWADIRDGTYAESWPDGVYHGELSPQALAVEQRMRIIQPGYIAEDGVEVSEQKQAINQLVGTSVHVHGGPKPSPGFTQVQDYIHKMSQQRRTEMRNDIAAKAFDKERRRLVKFFQELADTEQLEWKARELSAMLSAQKPLADADRNLALRHEDIGVQLYDLQQVRDWEEANHADAARAAKEMVDFRRVVNDLRSPLTKDVEIDLNHHRTSEPARFAAAEKFVEVFPTGNGKPSAQEAEAELAAVNKLVEDQASGKGPSIVLPNEKKSVWQKVTSWFRRS
jgi:hypothetical protein